MSNLYEMQLNATNNKSKEVRTLSHDLDLFISWQGQQVYTHEVYQAIDPYLYQKYNGKLGGKEIKQNERILDRYFEEHVKVKSKLGGNKKDYLFGNLFNEDGTPIPFEEKRGSKLSVLTLIFKAILLKLLNENQTDDEARTLVQWLLEFGFINGIQERDVKKFHQSIYDDDDLSENDEAEKRKDNDFVKMLFRRKVVPRSYERVPQGSSDLINYDLTDNEVTNLFKAYNKRTLQALKYRLLSALEALDKEKMIKHNRIMLGIEIYDRFNKDTKEFEKAKRLVELKADERIKLVEIELEIKTELELDHLSGYDLYMNKKYREALSKYLMFGIHTKNSCRKFEYVYEAHTITKRFSQSNLDTYFSKHEDIKEYFDKDRITLINDFRTERLNHILTCIDKQQQNREATIKQTYATKRQDKKLLGDSSQEIRDLKNNIAYSELAKILSTNLITYCHYDVLAPYEVPKIETAEIKQSSFDVEQLPL